MSIGILMYPYNLFIFLNLLTHLVSVYPFSTCIPVTNWYIKVPTDIKWVLYYLFIFIGYNTYLSSIPLSVSITKPLLKSKLISVPSSLVHVPLPSKMWVSDTTHGSGTYFNTPTFNNGISKNITKMRSAVLIKSSC